MDTFEKENEEVFALVRNNPTRAVDLSGSRKIIVKIGGKENGK